jgi:hypothetical protein
VELLRIEFKSNPDLETINPIISLPISIETMEQEQDENPKEPEGPEEESILEVYSQGDLPEPMEEVNPDEPSASRGTGTKRIRLPTIT